MTQINPADPIIITTKQSNGTINYEYLNLNLNSELNKEDEMTSLQSYVYAMDKINKPLPILVIDENPIIEIHFGDSFLDAYSMRINGRNGN